jgi:hypothetical protein
VSPTQPRKGRGQSRRRRAATETISQFRTRAAGVDQARIGDVTDPLPVDSNVCGRPKPRYGEPRQTGTLPVQGAVDRAVPLTLPTFDVEIFDGGKLVEILRFPIFPPGRFGTDVNDPANFSQLVDPRTSICAILDATSAIHCLARGGAW